MTLPPEPGAPKRVTLAELNDLVTRAKNNPVEKARLQENPGAVLESMGCVPSPDAVEFLRTLGGSEFVDKPEGPPLNKGSTGGGMAEV